LEKPAIKSSNLIPLTGCISKIRNSNPNTDIETASTGNFLEEYPIIAKIIMDKVINISKVKIILLF
jgi:hypothetical protein